MDVLWWKRFPGISVHRFKAIIGITACGYPNLLASLNLLEKTQQLSLQFVACCLSLPLIQTIFEISRSICSRFTPHEDSVHLKLRASLPLSPKGLSAL